LRIIFTASGGYVGGSTMAMFNLMPGLARLGLKPTLVSTRPLPRYQPLYRRLASLGVEIILIGPPRSGVSHWLHIGLAAVDVIRRTEVDVVHAHTPKEALFLYNVARATGRRFVLTLEGDPLIELAYAGAKLYDWVVNGPSFRLPLKMADGLAACSRWLADELRARYGVEARPIPNPVDVERFSSSAPAAVGGRKVVLALARLVPVKGIRTLLKAATLVLREDPEVECWVAGDGPERLWLEEKARSLGLEGKFRLLGYSSKPEELISQAHLLCMPSLYEPFGMPAAEAGAAGKPVVAARTGGLQEIVVEGETGLLHRPADYADLADKLLTLLTDEKLAARMGVKGRERVNRLFRPETVARQYMQLYLDVLHAS